ncbi:MAG: CesT family type III secretion system chaperone [Pseudomonadota bacterium]
MSGIPEQSVLSLVSALSDAIGQPIGFDDRGECVMDFDGMGRRGGYTGAAAVELVVSRSPDAATLTVRSTLTEAGHCVDLPLLERALGLNYTHMPAGHSIALDPVSRHLVLIYPVDAANASPDEFLRAVAGFLELVPQLRDELVPVPAASAIREMIMGVPA